MREEVVAGQIDNAIGKVTLDAKIADEIAAELTKESVAASEAAKTTPAATKAALTACEKQLDMLLEMRLSEQIGEQEYVSKKHVLHNRKSELRGGNWKGLRPTEEIGSNRPAGSFWRPNTGQNCSTMENLRKNAIFSKKSVEPTSSRENANGRFQNPLAIRR